MKRTRNRLMLLAGALSACMAGMLIAMAPMQLHAADRAGFPGASPTLGALPPMNDTSSIILFDGTSFDGWTARNGEPSPWTVTDRHDVIVAGGDAMTRAHFGDCQIHVEFFLPELPGRDGQARCNSGVYVHGRYEVQVLDTFGVEPYMGSCGALYGIAPPMVNASRPADTWQTYDIVFRAPRFDDAGAVTENPRITVMHNGVVIQNNVELPSVTAGGLDAAMVAEGPLLLQDHGDPVRFRNIWVRKLN